MTLSRGSYRSMNSVSFNAEMVDNVTGHFRYKSASYLLSGRMFALQTFYYKDTHKFKTQHISYDITTSSTNIFL